MSKKSKIGENLKILQEFEDDSSESEHDETIGEIFNLTLEGFTAEEDDFHGIQRLLGQTFRGLEIELGDLTDLVIAQNYVGCVIKQVIDDEKQAMDIDEDALDGEPDQECDAVMGLNTVFNITPRRRRPEGISKFREVLLKRCEGSDASQQSRQLFKKVLSSESEHVGLLINERFVNLPAQVSLPAFRTLQLEMEEANKIKMPFDFKYFIIICKTYQINCLKEKKKKKKCQAMGAAPAEGGTSKTKEIWSNAEEEIIAQMACASFEYIVSECSEFQAESWNEKEYTKKRETAYRKVLLLPADKLSTALDKAEAIAED